MKRAKHSLSHYKLTTFDMGELVPVACFEVLPGDTIQMATSALIRVSPMLAPVMHPVRVRIHHWFVPTRQVWSDFEKFITGGSDGLDATVYPNKSASHAEGSLGDYLGAPVGTSLQHSVLPFRVYQSIYNEFYRDQDLNTAAAVSTASGVDSTTDTTLKNVCWEKDYFTSARPWTQKGTEAFILMQGNNTDLTVKTSGSANVKTMMGSNGATNMVVTPAWSDSTAVRWVNAGLQFSVNDMRLSIALQKFAEARARFGSRYTEYLRSLGVTPQDARLDRPEYLGGGRQTIQFSEVIQSGTDYNANTGVGSLKGHGIGAMRSNRFRRFFGEHGYVMTLMSVMPKTIYAQSLGKMWNRDTNEKYYQKELEKVGQDSVLNKEVYTAHTTPNGVFGYQDRYDEYRRIESNIGGEFRSSLNHWHLARIFAGDPALNSSFVTANPTKRVLASTGTDGLYAMINHSIQARRIVSSRG